MVKSLHEDDWEFIWIGGGKGLNAGLMEGGTWNFKVVWRRVRGNGGCFREL